MKNKEAVEELFSESFLQRLARYKPNPYVVEPAKIISGRLIEEVVELHLESGGSATSAQMHVSDAITNECFKKFKLTNKLGGANQDFYPSRLEGTYNREAVTEELSDTLFLFIVNMLVSDVEIVDILSGIKLKLNKLEQAERDGRLTITDKGTFYVRKD